MKHKWINILTLWHIAGSFDLWCDVLSRCRCSEFTTRHQHIQSRRRLDLDDEIQVKMQFLQNWFPTFLQTYTRKETLTSFCIDTVFSLRSPTFSLKGFKDILFDVFTFLSGSHQGFPQFIYLYFFHSLWTYRTQVQLPKLNSLEVKMTLKIHKTHSKQHVRANWINSGQLRSTPTIAQHTHFYFLFTCPLHVHF